VKTDFTLRQPARLHEKTGLGKTAPAGLKATKEKPANRCQTSVAQVPMPALLRLASDLMADKISLAKLQCLLHLWFAQFPDLAVDHVVMKINDLVEDNRCRKSRKEQPVYGA